MHRLIGWICSYLATEIAHTIDVPHGRNHGIKQPFQGIAQLRAGGTEGRPGATKPYVRLENTRFAGFDEFYG